MTYFEKVKLCAIYIYSIKFIKESFNKNITNSGWRANNRFLDILSALSELFFSVLYFIKYFTIFILEIIGYPLFFIISPFMWAKVPESEKLHWDSIKGGEES